MNAELIEILREILAEMKKQTELKEYAADRIKMIDQRESDWNVFCSQQSSLNADRDSK